MNDDSPARNRMRDLGERFRAARAALDALREEVHAAIPDAVADGMPQSEIVAATGYNRERIRTINRDAIAARSHAASGGA
jgi:hypothetical protein